jgi:GTP-binding protein
MSKLSAKFLSSYAQLEQLPNDGKPEIAFIGRSNVGKSSLINAITERKGLAKTSSTPGKTQLLNYFSVNDQFYIVDMPGYGFAKVSKDKRHDWAQIAEQYFKRRKQLKTVVLLIDSRHEGLANDVAVVEWFSENNIPFVIALTKADKVKQQELARHEKTLKQTVFTADGIFKTSSEAGKGIRELRNYLLGLVNPAQAQQLPPKTEQNEEKAGQNPATSG